MFDAENAAWISVEERLPPRHKILTGITDYVWVRLKDGSARRGFYSYRHERFFIGDKRRSSEVTHWAEIVRKGKEKHP